MADVNLVVLSGKISKKWDVTEVETKNGTKPKLNATLKMDKGQGHYGYETLSAFGKYGVDQLDQADEGDWVIVRGKIAGYKNKDDHWVTNIDVESLKVGAGPSDDDAGFDEAPVATQEECPV